MPFYSISLRKPGRVGEPKTTFNEGSLNPTSAEAIELRVDLNAYKLPSSPSQHSPVAFWADLSRLLQRMREQGQPRPSKILSDSLYVENDYVDGGYVE